MSTPEDPEELLRQMVPQLSQQLTDRLLDVAKAFAQKGPPHGRPLLVFSSGRYWTRTSDHSSMETSEDFYPQIGLMLGRSNCA